MKFKISDFLSKNQKDISNLNFSSEILKGLSKNPKRLPSWLIFDDRGSELFREITALKDYHPSVCELEIFKTKKELIFSCIQEGQINLIELGSGDGHKTKILLDHFISYKRQLAYYPIDISKKAINYLGLSLKSEIENKLLYVHGVVADYFQGLDWVTKQNSKINFVLFLGSSIGNFDPPAAQSFLCKIHSSLKNNDYVMVGFDLMKDPKILYRSYNDPGGVFQSFNLNLLHRINRELDGDFDISAFIQQGHYSSNSGAVESFIYSTKDQTVRIKKLEREFHFKIWEAMQTEFSYKYNILEIEALAKNAGFQVLDHFFDLRGYYVDSIFKVKK